MSTNNVYTLLGASNHSNYERQPVDYYATDPHSAEIFLDKIKQDGIILPKEIYEPACGGGHLSEVLKNYGYTVYSSDLYNHGYGNTGIDFFKSDIKAECILTNPPYKQALPFVKKALESVIDNGYVIMFLRIQFLEGKERYTFFKDNPPKYIYVNSSRQNCARNGEFEKYKHVSAPVCFCWFIWKKGFKGETIIRWIK